MLRIDYKTAYKPGDLVYILNKNPDKNKMKINYDIGPYKIQEIDN